MADRTDHGDQGPDASTAELQRQLFLLQQENDSLRAALASAVRAGPGAQRLLEFVVDLTDDPSFARSLTALAQGYTTVKDVRAVKDMCQTICARAEGKADGDGWWRRLFQYFFELVMHFRSARPRRLVERDRNLPQEWFTEPWYYLYVQYFGTPDHPTDADPSPRATFDDLVEVLPYLTDLGFRNLYILPHYESPMGDGGYDVADFTVRKDLGGPDAYIRFMAKAHEAGFRVATDAVFNHVSTAHKWFTRACETGDPQHLSYFLLRNGREKVAEWEKDGDIYCRYRDPDGTLTERPCIFPSVDRTHGLWMEIQGKTYQFYRDFYPFQVDLNLSNPEVLRELLSVVGTELNQGVLGKRTDAVAHWIKKRGSPSDGLPETHAVQALLKSFMRHICPRSVVVPEVVHSFEDVAKYAGIPTEVNEGPCTSEGDLLFSFEMQAALRELTHFQTVAPFWDKVFRIPHLPPRCEWFNSLEHHDEIYMGFFKPEVRHWMADYLVSRGGKIFRNGLSAGCRYANGLGKTPERIAAAVVCLYIAPGVPMVYQGLELCVGNQPRHAEVVAQERHQTFSDLGVHVSAESCDDPRELQRGPISREEMYAALNNNEVVVRTLRKLNRLRAERASMRSRHVTPLDSGDIGILALCREAPDDLSLLCIVNLTQYPVTTQIPLWQASARLKVRTNRLDGLVEKRVLAFVSRWSLYRGR